MHGTDWGQIMNSVQTIYITPQHTDIGIVLAAVFLVIGIKVAVWQWGKDRK